MRDWKCRTGKCRTGKCRTKNAGPQNAGPNIQGWMMIMMMNVTRGNYSHRVSLSVALLQDMASRLATQRPLWPLDRLSRRRDASHRPPAHLLVPTLASHHLVMSPCVVFTQSHKRSQGCNGYKCAPGAKIRSKFAQFNLIHRYAATLPKILRYIVNHWISLTFHTVGQIFGLWIFSSTVFITPNIWLE